ncbi:hypothetical protein EN45_002620 [Penicillium chrysogenum]|uniref:Uncharacterized protein n=1 Tax=Penicillium chrysogenum TaxID=5076 RepID=A0A167V8J9_PENCH|nr:hypothetical protein EN45_002620 [Penicillium chrysogenum]
MAGRVGDTCHGTLFCPQHCGSNKGVDGCTDSERVKKGTCQTYLILRRDSDRMDNNRRRANSRAMWYMRLGAGGCFMPLLSNLVGLQLPLPSREEVSDT